MGNNTHTEGAFASLLRDSIVGQTIYYFSGRKLCKPYWEKDSYEIPAKYLRTTTESSDSVEGTKDLDVKDEEGDIVIDEAASGSAKHIIVDWDGPDDPTNPQNWCLPKKSIVAIIMAFITASLYMGSALYTPAVGQLIQHFDTSLVKVTLGLSMFVWGYGLASLLVSPMSENPIFGGRLYIYVFCQTIFAIMQIPTALVNNVAGFAVLRLIGGLMAAPPLSTGGATYNDIFAYPTVVYALIVWSVGAIMGPCIGPLIGAALVQHNTWRWAFWYLLIQAGAVLFFMLLFFPETSAQAILMKKARSLRRRTGNPNILSTWDIQRRTQDNSQVLKKMLWNPIKLTIREPVLLLIDVHIGLVYSVLYLYFEAVPIAYGETYHFNLVKQGLTYISLMIGCYVAAALYIPYLQTLLIKPSLQGKAPDPYTIFGNVAIFASVLFPIGLLLYGWTASVRVHWVVSMVGNLLVGSSVWLMFQSYLAVLSSLYPPSQLASAMASNSVARAMLAAAFPLFARSLYKNTAIHDFEVGWGCTILAFISIPLIGLPIYLKYKGEDIHHKALLKYGDK